MYTLNNRGNSWTKDASLWLNTNENEYFVDRTVELRTYNYPDSLCNYNSIVSAPLWGLTDYRGRNSEKGDDLHRYAAGDALHRDLNMCAKFETDENNYPAKITFSSATKTTGKITFDLTKLTYCMITDTQPTYTDPQVGDMYQYSDIVSRFYQYPNNDITKITHALCPLICPQTDRDDIMTGDFYYYIIGRDDNDNLIAKYYAQIPFSSDGCVWEFSAAGMPVSKTGDINITVSDNATILNAYIDSGGTADTNIDILSYVYNEETHKWTYTFQNNITTELDKSPMEYMLQPYAYIYKSENIYEESVKIVEALTSDGIPQPGAVNASTMEISVDSAPRYNQGIRYELIFSSTTNNGDTDTIKMGEYTITNCERDGIKARYKLTMQDNLSLFNADVYEWWNGLTFPKTVKQLRDGLCYYLRIKQEDIALINDDMIITERPEMIKCNNNQIMGYEILSIIAEINGVIPTINRLTGAVRYVWITTNDTHYILPYYDPDNTLVDNCVPMPINKISTAKPDNEKISNSQYSVYNIYNNPLKFFMTDENKENLRKQLNKSYVDNGVHFWYMPAEVKTNGCPFLALGDGVYIPFSDDIEGDQMVWTRVIRHEITGINAMKSLITAEGISGATVYTSNTYSSVQDETEEDLLNGAS